MEPINYSAMQTAPLDAFQSGLDTFVTLEKIGLQRQQIADAQRKAAQAEADALQKAEQQKQAQGIFAKLAANPNATAEDYAGLLAVAPQFKDQVKTIYDMRDSQKQRALLADSGRVFSALRSKRPDVAKAWADEQVAARENSGDKEGAQQFKTLSQAIEQSPDVARAMTGAYLAALPGGKDFMAGLKDLGAEDGEAAERPGKIAKTAADTQQALASAAKTKEETRLLAPAAAANIRNINSQILERGRRIALDRDRFDLDFETKLLELKNSQGVPKLSAGMEKLQADSVGQAITAKSLANRADTAAEALKQANLTLGGKPLRWLAENSKKVFGSEDAFSDIRREFIRVRAQEMLSDLPPGPASNYDIQNVKKGYPDDSAEPEVIQRWLTSFGNVQRALALREEYKAEWLSAVGSMRNAPQDIQVGETTVPAGTSFVNFVKQVNGGGASQPAQNAPSEPGYMRYGR